MTAVAIESSQLSRAQLREAFANAESKQDRMGLVYELTSYRLLDGGTVYYDRGIKPVMLALAAANNTSPILANHILTGVDLPVGKLRFGAGSQMAIDLPETFELDVLNDRLRGYVSHVAPIAQSLGMGLSSLAFHPDRDPTSIQIVSKQRYPVMQRRFRESGKQGLAIMTNAASMTVRITARNEKDAVEKYRAAVLLTPVIQAVFANSPLDRGRFVPAVSQRILSWLDVDRARTSFFGEAFAKDMSYDKYIDWALGVPVLGIDRDGRAIDVGDMTFKQCLEGGKLYIGAEDWHGHLDTLWPAVRLTHRGIELRVSDTGTQTAAMGLLALVKGAVMEPVARKQLLASFKYSSDFARLPQKAARFGLYAQGPEGRLLDMAKAAARIAKGGLQRIAAKETKYIGPMDSALSRILVPADEIRERYGRDWKDLQALFAGTRIQ
jgi:glutamate--cysteine ligase